MFPPLLFGEDKQEVIITNLHFGMRKNKRSDILYAELRDKKTNELIIASTFDYIVKQINKVVTSEKGTEV